jgi:phospholipid/cholesterol/gamma-HCH transport system permease protein
MLPVLTIIANATAIVSAWLTLIIATTATTNDYVTGLRLSFAPFQVTYSVIKAVCFGGAIAIVCSYEGYVTGAGAEGVGRSTAKAVVIASTSILVLDAIVAAVFAQFIAA